MTAFQATKQKRQFHDLPLGYEISLYFGEDGGSVTVTQGTASGFGAPFTPNQSYAFMNQGIPISTTQGCRLDVVGAIKVGQPGPLDSAPYELHAVLQRERSAVKVDTSSGPRVLVVGETDTGKSSLCRTLINLGLAGPSSSSSSSLSTEHPSASAAVGAKRTRDAMEKQEDKDLSSLGITYMDVDLGQTALSVPGAIATVFLTEPVGPVESYTMGTVPLSFYFGESSLRNHNDLSRYLDIIACNKKSIDAFEATKPGFHKGGTIINTMGWVEGMGLKALQGIMDVCGITHVIIAGGNKELFDAMQKTVSENVGMRYTQVLHYRSQKNTSSFTGGSGKTFVRNRNVRRAARMRMITEYFVGTPQRPLVSPRLVLKLKDCTFLDATTFGEYEYPPALALCAVSTAVDYEQVPHANAAGFVVITDVGQDTVTVLAPSSGGLPSKVFLVSRTIAMDEDDLPPVTNQ